MLVVCSDTHGADDPHLTGRTREAVDAADLVIHAGDFTTPAVLDAFRAAADRLVAVHGNADVEAVSARLPAAASTTYAGVPVAVTHTERGGATGLSLFGRERGAALVVSGHTHRPTVVDADDGGPTLLNPGSHADPRGNRPGHAELWGVDDDLPAVVRDVDRPASGLVGVVRTPDGDVIERIRVPLRD
ncbi:metallophosphoesterase [Haloplanus rallus]|jgi:putative phosphoesterase|uniref:Phosphoesterase n=1 Tax=Haloplanus rallus TaxID=1816183 RepID=A0A6B9F5F3_9EURY|nr:MULTISPECIES: metallophosphoesterase [Haloplanus]QGX95716.1 metallophosphoesterase [Haloplanus rallus]